MNKSISSIKIGSNTYFLNENSVRTALSSTYLLQKIVYNSTYPTDLSGVENVPFSAYVNINDSTWTIIRSNTVNFNSWTGIVLGIAYVNWHQGTSVGRRCIRLFYGEESSNLEYDLGKLNDSNNIGRGMGKIELANATGPSYQTLFSTMSISNLTENNVPFYLKGWQNSGEMIQTKGKYHLLFFKKGGSLFANGSLTVQNNV